MFAEIAGGLRYGGVLKTSVDKAGNISYIATVGFGLGAGRFAGAAGTTGSSSGWGLTASAVGGRGNVGGVVSATVSQGGSSVTIAIGAEGTNRAFGDGFSGGVSYTW